MATSKRRATRNKSIRPTIEVSDDYEERAALILNTIYHSYKEAEKAVDDWQELEGQLTHIDEEIFPGKRAKRGSQPETVKLICKSAEVCTFKCKIKLQLDTSYRILFSEADTVHTCAPGAPPATKSEPGSPDMQIPQALQRHLTSHESPTIAKRNKSINLWRHGVAASSLSTGLPFNETRLPDLSSIVHFDSDANEQPSSSKHKRPSGIRKAMQGRPSAPKEPTSDDNQQKASSFARFVNSVTQMTEKVSKDAGREKNRIYACRLKGAKAAKPATARKSTSCSSDDFSGIKLPDGIWTMCFTEISHIDSLELYSAPDSDSSGGYITVADKIRNADSKTSENVTPAAEGMDCRPVRSSEHIRVPILPAETLTPANLTSVKSKERPTKSSNMLNYAKSNVSAEDQTRQVEVPGIMTQRSISANSRSCQRKRKADAPYSEEINPPEEDNPFAPATKRIKAAAPDILLKDSLPPIGRHLVAFLATAGIHTRSDILNLGMESGDMEQFVPAVRVKMEEFTRMGASNAQVAREAVRKCADAITIAKFKTLLEA